MLILHIFNMIFPNKTKPTEIKLVLSTHSMQIIFFYTQSILLHQLGGLGLRWMYANYRGKKSRIKQVLLWSVNTSSKGQQNPARSDKDATHLIIGSVQFQYNSALLQQSGEATCPLAFSQHLLHFVSYQQTSCAWKWYRSLWNWSMCHIGINEPLWLKMG